MTEVPPWETNEPTERLRGIWAQAAAAATFGSNRTAVFGGGHTHAYDVVGEKRGGLSDGNWLWQDYPTIDGWVCMYYIWYSIYSDKKIIYSNI